MSAPAGGAFAAARRGASYSDVVLACGVVAIVALMILPLPLLLIDILVAVNILVGVGLLLLAIYIPHTTAFSSFPSVLLLSTLFRLSLSIAITRLILLDADAGHIIDTFGNLVAGGNLVVGIVVFLIITVVQFIVIAKGAERVAEVAARFTLDAMPGKQLSIDSDLRSGLIDKDEARRRRRLLEQESQLHGALDGAMKFVKGDAIAGIVIILINILGGLAIGVLQRDMPLSEAVHTYSILTIGDGLVAQIPALLSAMAAGLIVTRTAGEDDDRHLGEAIGRQISGHPRVTLIAGVLALLLMGVPGFPWPVFGVLGIALLATWVWRTRPRAAALRRVLKLPPAPQPQEPPEALSAVEGELMLPAPVVLEIDAQLAGTLGRETLLNLLGETFGRLRESSGVPIPSPSLRLLPLGEPVYRLIVHGLRVATGELQADKRFRRALPAPALNETSLVQAARHFQPPFDGDWVAATADAQGDGAALLTAGEVLQQHLQRALRRHIGAFIGIQETSNLIARWSREYPDLIKEMLRVVAPQRVSEVLRRLVEEGLSIRNLRDVFEAITDAGGREKDVALLTELVRAALRRHISDRYAAADRSLPALLAHPEFEDQLRQSLRGAAPGSQAALDPELLGRVLRELRALRDAQRERFEHAVLLCSADVRRHLRRLLEGEFFELPVLSFQELVGDLQVVPIGQLRG